MDQQTIHISKVDVPTGIFVINADGEALRLCWNKTNNLFFLTNFTGLKVTDNDYGSIQALFEMLHPDAKMYQLNGIEPPRLVSDKIYVTLDNLKSVFAKQIKVPMEKIIITTTINRS